MEEEKRQLAYQARIEAVKAICFLCLVAIVTTLIAVLALHGTQVLLGTVITTWGLTVNQCAQHFGAVRERFEVKGEVIHTRHEVRGMLNKQGLEQRERDEGAADTLVAANRVKQSEPLTPEAIEQMRVMFTEISVKSCEAIAEVVVKRALAEYHEREHNGKAKV